VRPEEALDEALKQLVRVVPADLVVAAAAEPGGALRVAAARGGEGGVGALLADPRLDAAREERRAVRVADAEAEGRPDLPGAPAVRSWAALPLLHEAEVVGVLVAGRAALDAFTDDEMQLAKIVAFWTAAALVRVLQLEQLRRYATLLEQVAHVDEKAFGGEGPEALSPAILDGACRVGGYRGGLLVLQTPRGPFVAATSGDAFAAALRRPAPADLASAATRRLPAARMLDVAEALGVELPVEQVFLVPLATDEGWLGCLTLVDPNGESPEDRLLEAYASRAAAAYRHAALHHGRS
jgi:GAF domain-containing protein